MEVDNHETGLDPVFTSGSQPTIRYSSNSTMEDDLDASAETTALDTLISNRNFRKKQRFREKQKEKKRKSRL